MESLLGPSKIQVFRCPRCHEMINTGLDRCGFCGVGIDRHEAQKAVAIQRKVNRAIENANYTRILAGSLPLLYIGGLKNRSTPLIIWGMVPLLLGFPFWLAGGWWKYQEIPPFEPNLLQARNHLLLASGLWLATVVVWLVVYFWVGYPELHL